MANEIRGPLPVKIDSGLSSEGGSDLRDLWA